jgi:hypothetical protein
MTRTGVLIAVLVPLALCAGCNATDPYQRASLWQPDGVVQGDMAAMVADPHDLVAGHGPDSPAQYGPDGVQPLWNGNPKPLLTNSDTGAGGGGSSGAGSSGAGN